MSTTVQTQPAGSAAGPPGTSGVLRGVRRLLVWALCCGIGYTILTTASSSFCPGGFTSDGGYVDTNGNPTDVAPACISLTLKPSPFVYAALVAIVLVALSLAIRRGSAEVAALRILNRARIAIGITALACIVIGDVWFALIPITQWDGVHTAFWFPFPFAAVTQQITPLPH